MFLNTSNLPIKQKKRNIFFYKKDNNNIFANNEKQRTNFLFKPFNNFSNPFNHQQFNQIANQ